MGFFKKDKVEPAQGVVAEDQGKVEHKDEVTEAALLEKHLTEDPAGAAALTLETFKLSPASKRLLDRAADNVAKNKGGALPDEDAKAKAEGLSDLIEDCDNDIATAIDVLEDTVEDERELASMVYSLLYTVMKSAMFIGNLDYRRAIDPKGDFDLRAYLHGHYGIKTKGEDGNDPRELDDEMPTDARYESSPLEGQSGHETSQEREMALLRQLYGKDVDHEFYAEEVIPMALEDLRLFFQLQTEAFGWNPEQPMPFCTEANPDGTFAPVTDVMRALDVTEIKRKESAAKRNKRQAALLVAAREKARATRRAALRA